MQPQSSSDNIWHHKPWWCQPWSIVLTGIAVIGGSWLVLHRIWLTALVAVPILAWMGFFLLVYPNLMNQMLAEEAKQAIRQFPETEPPE